MQIGNDYDDAIQISEGALAPTETFFSSCDFGKTFIILPSSVENLAKKLHSKRQYLSVA